MASKPDKPKITFRRKLDPPLPSDLSDINITANKDQVIAKVELATDSNGSSTILAGGVPILTFKYNERGPYIYFVTYIVARLFGANGHDVKVELVLPRDSESESGLRIYFAETGEPVRFPNPVEKQAAITWTEKQAHIAARYLAEYFSDDLILTISKLLRIATVYGETSSVEREEQLATETMLREVEIWQRKETQVIKERLKARGPGQPSQWTRRDLMYALLDAQGELQKLGKPMTYETVREMLQQNYPGKTPATANALRLLLQRFRINWKQFKSAR